MNFLEIRLSHLCVQEDRSSSGRRFDLPDTWMRLRIKRNMKMTHFTGPVLLSPNLINDHVNLKLIKLLLYLTVSYTALRTTLRLWHSPLISVQII